jgi:DNA-binding MarR family transcriptional regulator
MSTAVLAAIATTPSIVIIGWLELEEYINSQAVNYDRRALLLTSELMALWCVSQPTVSRRLAGINKAGLARIKHADGYQGGWWVKR